MEQTFKLVERKSPQIKELRLLYEDTEKSGIYKVFSQWPGYPSLDNYGRILYNQNDPDKIDGLDFDGGPMIYRGYKPDKHNIITDIYCDKTTYEFLVKVEKVD